MSNLKKILKDNKYTMIGILIFIVIALLVSLVYNILFSGAGAPIYGNRLDGIEEVEITKGQQEKLVEVLKEEEKVVEASTNIKGKILNVHITVSEGTKIEDAKKLTNKITEIIEQEQKEFYDIQVFINIEGENIDGYPTIGYLGKAEKEFKYSSATYDEDGE